MGASETESGGDSSDDDASSSGGSGSYDTAEESDNSDNSDNSSGSSDGSDDDDSGDTGDTDSSSGRSASKTKGAGKGKPKPKPGGKPPQTKPPAPHASQTEHQHQQVRRKKKRNLKSRSSGGTGKIVRSQSEGANGGRSGTAGGGSRLRPRKLPPLAGHIPACMKDVGLSSTAEATNVYGAAEYDASASAKLRRLSALEGVSAYAGSGGTHAHATGRRRSKSAEPRGSPKSPRFAMPSRTRTSSFAQGRPAQLRKMKTIDSVPLVMHQDPIVSLSGWSYMRPPQEAVPGPGTYPEDLQPTRKRAPSFSLRSRYDMQKPESISPGPVYNLPSDFDRKERTLRYTLKGRPPENMKLAHKMVVPAPNHYNTQQRRDRNAGTTLSGGSLLSDRQAFAQSSHLDVLFNKIALYAPAEG